MSILPPLSSHPFTRARLAELLASNIVSEQYMHLLRWLIWFPLLSCAELTRLEQARLLKADQTRSQGRTAALLQDLEEAKLISHLVINEPGWSSHQHRYAITDAGLYVFASHMDPQLSVPKLVQAYAVERSDLIARLARTDILLVLADFSTRLVSEGSKQGYPLLSYQQPWVQSDTIFGHRQTIRCDAAFLLGTKAGTEHAFYVRVDTNERHIFDDERERILLTRLLNLRSSLHLQREAMPQLLILTGPSRLPLWGELLAKTSEKLGTAVLSGAITTLDCLQRDGISSPIWWTTFDLVQSLTYSVPSHQLSQLLGSPISTKLSERFSQRSSFEHLRTLRKSDLQKPTARPLPAYIGKPLTEVILDGSSLSDALVGTKAEKLEAVALLNLTLSATQKDLLFWLTHHPLLSVHQLSRLHYPDARDIRSTRIQMNGLSELSLLVPFAWYKAGTWQERERYVLSESALRYSALREGRPITHYLLEEKYKSKYKVQAFTIQQGTSGLFAQMQHTHGVYESIVSLMAKAEKVVFITWKSARECVRPYRNPLADKPMQVRPDAEAIYLIEGQVHSLLLEYDRATTGTREGLAKYEVYADYEQYTSLTLPPLLIITQNEHAARLIRSCVDEVSSSLSALIILEEQLQEPDLLAMLIT